MSPLQFLFLAILKFQWKISSLRRANLGKFKLNRQHHALGRASVRRLPLGVRTPCWSAAHPRRPSSHPRGTRAEIHLGTRSPARGRPASVLAGPHPPSSLAPRLPSRPPSPLLPCFEEKLSNTPTTSPAYKNNTLFLPCTHTHSANPPLPPPRWAPPSANSRRRPSLRAQVLVELPPPATCWLALHPPQSHRRRSSEPSPTTLPPLIIPWWAQLHICVFIFSGRRSPPASPLPPEGHDCEYHGVWLWTRDLYIMKVILVSLQLSPTT
jgi:hypothetical protein